MRRVHWSDREGHALSIFQRGAHDSDVHDQVSNGTCYAFTVDRLDRKLDDEVSKLRAELSHVLERPRRRRFMFFGRR